MKIFIAVCILLIGFFIYKGNSIKSPTHSAVDDNSVNVQPQNINKTTPKLPPIELPKQSNDDEIQDKNTKDENLLDNLANIQKSVKNNQPIKIIPAVAVSNNYTCDGRKHCSQMHSCEEAKFFLQNCPNTKMDGDNDGTPCEDKWCKWGL